MYSPPPPLPPKDALASIFFLILWCIFSFKDIEKQSMKTIDRLVRNLIIPVSSTARMVHNSGQILGNPELVPALGVRGWDRRVYYRGLTRPLHHQHLDCPSNEDF